MPPWLFAVIPWLLGILLNVPFFASYFWHAEFSPRWKRRLPAIGGFGLALIVVSAVHLFIFVEGSTKIDLIRIPFVGIALSALGGWAMANVRKRAP